MRFTNSPFERMMTQRPSPGRAAPASPVHPPGHPCHRCPYGLNAPCVGICYKNLKKEREKNATCDRGKTVGSDGSV
ncbi:hypothetical protein D5281_21505 [bacterium 1xD42-62]|jgi:hypothetical protein|uniref:Uncharacterized protein n=2 Tax=Bacteria TaxID=2 RepID=A0A9X5GUD7_9FIRM|nr:hypothetical protein [Parablautia muri]